MQSPLPDGQLSSYDQVCARFYGLMRARLTPGLRNSQYDYAETLSEALKGKGRWLDVGCGPAVLPTWLARSHRQLDTREWVTVGIDLDQQAIRRNSDVRWRVIGDVESLPFDDESFSLVTANMVVEHVEDPTALFEELKRVVQPQGRIIIHTPNARGYTTMLTRLVPQVLLVPLARLLLNRKASDVYRTYYRANSVAALSAIAARVGLVIETFRYVDASPQFIRVPPLMTLELGLIRTFRHPSLAQGRACILATFRRSATRENAATAPGRGTSATESPATR